MEFAKYISYAFYNLRYYYTNDTCLYYPPGSELAFTVQSYLFSNTYVKAQNLRYQTKCSKVNIVAYAPDLGVTYIRYNNQWIKISDNVISLINEPENNIEAYVSSIRPDYIQCINRGIEYYEGMKRPEEKQKELDALLLNNLNKWNHHIKIQ